MCAFQYLRFVTVFSLCLLDEGVIGSITWSYFESGGSSTQGRLNTLTTISSISHCAAECYTNEKCEIFGHDSARKVCFLHDGSLSTINSYSSSTLKFYRASCHAESTYNFDYIRSLNRCILYANDKMAWDDARQFCENSGGHLIYVKTQAVLDYISDQRRTVNSKFWIGGTQVQEGLNDYQWYSGEVLNSTNGGQFWLNGLPDTDGRRGKICIETRYWSSQSQFGFKDRLCNYTRNFFCEKDVF